MDALDTSLKTVLDVAQELGVRSETVLNELQRLGLEAESIDAPIDADVEELLVEHLADSGAVPEKMRSGKGRMKKSPGEPSVNDDMLFEALGSSESGFSERNIPSQLRVESGFADEGSWFSKLFSPPKKEITKSLQDTQPNDEELNAYFTSYAERSPRTAVSPLREAESDYVPEEEELDTVDEGIELPEELDEFDFDDGLLDEIEDLDIEDIDISELDTGDLEELAMQEGEPPEEVGGEELEGVDEEEIDISGELENVELDEGDVEIGEEPKEGEFESEFGEEEEEPGFLERIISRIHLTPAEMWTLTGGSLVIMLILLGVTVYWWLNISPKAQQGLLAEANGYYSEAQEAETSDLKIEKYNNAAETYIEFITKFPQHDQVLQAYENLCNSYRQIALEYEGKGEKENSFEPYRKSIIYYEQFYNYLEDRSNLFVQRINEIEDPEERRQRTEGRNYLAFPDAEKQEDALFNIADARWKINQFSEAIQSFREFVNKFGDSPQAPQARLNIGQIYQDWAKINKEQELQLLQQASEAYEEALTQNPQDSLIAKMDLYYGLGTIKKTQYNRTLAEQKEDQAESYLLDAIAYMEKAEEVAREIPNLSVADKTRIFKFLAELYLIRGKARGKDWRQREQLAELYPEGTHYKKELEQGAAYEKTNTEENLGNAMKLYNELLAQRLQLPPEDEYEILYNKAEALRILQRYPQALSTGEELIQTLKAEQEKLAPNEEDKFKDLRTKTYYLLGHIAWENANGRNYSKVKEYYKKALEEDDYYPTEEDGETSHLAEIRLTNIYFMLEGKYAEAMDRFARTVDRFPEDGYSFLTFYWYGKASEEYGDKLLDEAKELEDSMNSIGTDKATDAKYESLKQHANQLYQNAIEQYGRAIAVRDKSTYIDTLNQRFLIDIYFHRGFCAFKKGDYVGPDSAETYLKTALQQFKNHHVAQQYFPEAIERLGDLYATMYDNDEAIRWYRRYLEDESQADPDSHVKMKLADAYLQGLFWDKAREKYSEIIQDNPPLTQRAIERERKNGREPKLGPGYVAMIKKAQSYYDQAGIESDPQKRDGLKRQALAAYQEFAKLYPSMDSSKNANPLVPSDVVVQKRIGDLYYELGEFDNAAMNYKEFLQNQSDYPRKGFLFSRIGRCYLETGKLDEAINTLTLISVDQMDTPEQYADSIIMLGNAYQKKADAMKQKGDDLQYEVNLNRAVEVYNKAILLQKDYASNPGVKQKSDQALQYRQAIMQILDNRQELAASSP